MEYMGRDVLWDVFAEGGVVVVVAADAVVAVVAAAVVLVVVLVLVPDAAADNPSSNPSRPTRPIPLSASWLHHLAVTESDTHIHHYIHHHIHHYIHPHYNICSACHMHFPVDPKQAEYHPYGRLRQHSLVYMPWCYSYY